MQGDPSSRVYFVSSIKQPSSLSWCHLALVGRLAMNGYSHLAVSVTLPVLKTPKYITLQISLVQAKGLLGIWSILRSKSLLLLAIPGIFLFPFFSSPQVLFCWFWGRCRQSQIRVYYTVTLWSFLLYCLFFSQQFITCCLYVDHQRTVQSVSKISFMMAIAKREPMMLCVCIPCALSCICQHRMHQSFIALHSFWGANEVLALIFSFNYYC